MGRGLFEWLIQENRDPLESTSPCFRGSHDYESCQDAIITMLVTHVPFSLIEKWMLVNHDDWIEFSSIVGKLWARNPHNTKIGWTLTKKCQDPPVLTVN